MRRLLVPALLLAAACVDLNVNPPTILAWDTQLVPATAFPGITGQGAAVSQATGTLVGLDIQGAAPGAQHAWGLRLGTCAAPGQQVGQDNLYPILDVDGAGAASVETHLGTQLSDNADYHIAVRVSASDTTRVACGDLTPH